MHEMQWSGFIFFEFFKFLVKEALEITHKEQASISTLTQYISSLSALARSC